MNTEIICKISEKIYWGAYFKGFSHAFMIVAVVLIIIEIYKRINKKKNIENKKLDQNTVKAIKEFKENRKKAE